MIKPDGLMMIEPLNKGRENPVIDKLTCQMTYALRKSHKDMGFSGSYTCVCGALNDRYHYFYDGALTNSLAVHYLAFHRDEVPESELEKVRAIQGSMYPTPNELYGRQFNLNG